jgi:SAM-dependent methyltransferase
MPAILEGVTNLPPAWALEIAEVTAGDEGFPPALDGVNLVLNRMRLAAFLAEFAEDKDVRDFLTLDAMAAAAGIPLSSTGVAADGHSLAIRPFRIWEYVWLYKTLNLSTGGRRVLDLGGPASHLSVLAALAGCQVTSFDVNPAIVQAARECAGALGLDNLDARAGDMRDLSALPSDSVDAVMSSSVLEHLTAADQEIALREMARVLKPGGMIGLTFDFGLPAPGANDHLPIPHDPPPDPAEALRRYLQPGLVLAGNPFSDNPIPGSLFRDGSVQYTVASLFLWKTPFRPLSAPKPETGTPVASRLKIENPLYRMCKCASSRAALLHHAEAAAREAEWRSSILEQACADRLAAMQELEQACADRLAAMHDRDRAIVRLHAGLNAADSGTGR